MISIRNVFRRGSEGALDDNTGKAKVERDGGLRNVGSLAPLVAESSEDELLMVSVTIAASKNGDRLRVNSVSGTNVYS